MDRSETGRDSVPGAIVRTVEIPARHGAAIEVGRGEVLRVVDVEGEQVGAHLVSDRGRPMMRLIADTVGVHDLICGSCSEEYYRNRLGHPAPHRSCRSNLAEAMAPWGVALGDIPFSFNVFMRWPVESDGTVVPMAAPSRAGDYADFVVEMDLVVANSACPSDITPANAHNPTPMRFVLYQPAR